MGACLPGLYGAESHTGFRSSSRVSGSCRCTRQKGEAEESAMALGVCVFSNFSSWKKRWALTKTGQKVERGISWVEINLERYVLATRCIFLISNESEAQKEHINSIWA